MLYLQNKIKNMLLCHIEEFLQHFRAVTGNTLVSGNSSTLKFITSKTQVISTPTI